MYTFHRCPAVHVLLASSFLILPRTCRAISAGLIFFLNALHTAIRTLLVACVPLFDQ